MQPMNSDAMVTFMIGERTVDYEYTWMSGDRIAVTAIAALKQSPRWRRRGLCI